MNFTIDQLSAINKEGNIIVSAGAGSGKTAVLTERVLRKIKDGIHINELLILTFTKEAAKEMKERIRKKLIDNNYIEELTYIDSSFITTFDSFALSLVKKYYYLLNINPDINVITNLDVEKNKILDNIFELNYKENDLFKKMINELCNKDDKNIKSFILSISNKISLKYNYQKYLEDYININYSEEVINKNIEEYINLIKLNISKIINIIDDIRLIDDNYYNKLDIFDNLIKSNTYKDIVENINIEIPRLPNNSSEELKNKKEELKKLLDKTKLYIKYNNINDYKEEILKTKEYVSVIISILKQYYLELNNYKKSINRYEFNDISFMAIDIVKNNNIVKEEIKNSFNEIMIDEYQDTNDIQEYFVSLISNNNVYSVGDIKQSIYRFRNANPLIFKNKYELYKNNQNGIKIDLNNNFRSRSNVIDGINNIFNYLMDINYGEANYKLEHQLISGNKDYKNNVYDQNYDLEILKYDSSEDYSKEEAEIFIIADDILNKVKNKYQIYDKNKFRDCKFEDFAILIDRSTYFDLIKKIFEYKKIPLSILKNENINNEIEINLFKNLLNLIIKYNKKEYDLSFKYSLTSILRSYIIGLSDDEIFNMYLNNNFFDNIVIEKIKNIKLLSINQVLNDIINEFDIYTKLVNVGNIDSKTNLINYLLTLGEEKSSIGFTIEEFKNYLDDLIDLQPKIEYSVNENKSGVKLMTIYKSKGLQFPICYIPFLYKEFNILELKEMILYDNKLGIITPYYDNGIKSTFYKTLMKVNYLKEEITEEIRLFYVALTRAQEKIILLYNNDKEKEIYKENFKSFKDFITYLEPYLNFNTVIPNVIKEYNKIKDINKLDIYCIDNKVNEINIIKEEKIKNNYSYSSKSLISKEDYNNMNYGIKLHEKLEEFDLNDEIVKKFINHKEIKDINLANIYHEYEFIYNDSVGIIDLLLEYDKEIIIVDFKTENIDKNEYNNQVKQYMNYIKSISKKNIKGYLYSILKDEIKEVL